MKKELLCLFYMIMTFMLSAASIRMQVVNSQNIGISDVIITDGHYIVMSDSLGYFYINQQQTSTEYQISKMGFKGVTATYKEMLKNKKIILKQHKYQMKAINVIAKEEEISQQIRSGEIIKIDNVNHKNLNSMADWLNNQQGLQVKGLDLGGEKKTLSIGGHSSRHTIVMLDGIILNPTGQDVDLSLINNDRIESIEIIKNNAGIESGAGGIAGIIKIRSKKFNEQNKISISSSTGSFDSSKYTFNLISGIKKSKLNLSYSIQKTDNDFTFYNRQLKKEDIRKNNHKEQQQLSLGSQIHLSNLMVDYQFNYLNYNNNLPGTYNYSQAFAGSNIKGYSVKNSVNLKSNFFDSSQEWLVYSNTDRNNYKNLKTSIPLYHADTRNFQRINGAKASFLKSFPIIDLRHGIEFKTECFESKDKLKPSAGIPLLSRETYSAYISFSKENEYQLFDFRSQASTRMDYNKEFKTNLSWRLEQNIKYHTFVSTEFYINYGTSFSLPSFYDLYWKGDSQTTGNPDLKPETSAGYRTGVRIGENPSFEQSYWKNNTKDLIYWFRSLKAWKPGNITDAEIQNFESLFKYKFFKLNTISLSYNRTIAKDKSKNPDGSNADFYNKDLIYTPTYQWKASYLLNSKYLTQTIEYQATGKQFSTRDQLKKPLSAYEKWDSHTSLTWVTYGFDFNLISSFYNILNESYEIYDYIPEPGFHWQIMLKIGRNI